MMASGLVDAIAEARISDRDKNKFMGTTTSTGNDEKWEVYAAIVLWYDGVPERKDK